MYSNNYLIYSKKDFTVNSAGQKRMLYYAKALTTGTDKVFLLSCCADNIDLENFKEIDQNIFVQRIVKKTNSILGKYRFVKRMFVFSQELSGNKTFIFYPAPFVLFETLALTFLKGIKKQKVFYEFNEVRKYSAQFSDPYTLRRPMYSIKKLIFAATINLAIQLLRYYDGIICISTSIQDYAKKYNKTTMRIPILTDSRMAHQKSGNVYFSNGEFNIGFAGSIYNTKERLNLFIEVILGIRRDGYPVTFNLCGHITQRYRAEFLNFCEDHSCINYFGDLNDLELSTFLSQQDLLVIPRGFTLQNHYGFSTKLSDYLNHKKMVLATDISDINMYITDGLNGFVVPPDDQAKMQKKIIYIIENCEGIRQGIEHYAAITSREIFDYSNYSKPLRHFLLKH